MEAIQGNGLWQVFSNGGGKVTPAGKLICEDLSAEGVPAVVEKAPTAIEIDIEDGDEAQLDDGVQRSGEPRRRAQSTSASAPQLVQAAAGGGR
jgi:hypothetical protein